MNVNQEISKTRKHDEEFDKLEAELLDNFETWEAPLQHKFINGMYLRTIFMPAGSVVTSLIHKTKHPFFVSKGKFAVFSENDGVQMITAPHKGMTTPGTRRLLRIYEDTIFTTSHLTNIVPENDSEEALLKAVDLVGEEIIDWRPNNILQSVIKNNEIVKPIENVQ